MKANSNTLMQISMANGDDDCERQREHNCHQRGEAEHAPAGPSGLHRVRAPNRPFGRNANVASSMRNTTISPESAPTN